VNSVDPLYHGLNCQFSFFRCSVASPASSIRVFFAMSLGGAPTTILEAAINNERECRDLRDISADQRVKIVELEAEVAKYKAKYKRKRKRCDELEERIDAKKKKIAEYRTTACKNIDKLERIKKKLRHERRTSFQRVVASDSHQGPNDTHGEGGDGGEQAPNRDVSSIELFSDD